MGIQVGQSQAFASFPEFTRLSLADKEDFESYMNSYPPVDDASFATLMSAWWNPLDNMSVSVLNGNLIVPYWMAGDDSNAGLSLLGTRKVDETICTIFDHLRQKGDEVKLVDVPDYVIANVQFPELFHFSEQRKHAEYIVPTSRFYPLQGTPFYWRKRVHRHLKKIEGREVIVRSVNLLDPRDSEMLLESLIKWQPKQHNNLGRVEHSAIKGYMMHSEELEIKNLCLFVDGKLLGFVLYASMSDKRYVTVKHFKATDRSMLSLELLAYMFTKQISQQGVTYINLNSDLGILPLRMFLLALGPCNFFRKYIVRPA